MDLSTFIISVFCLIDDRLKGRHIRRRGPAPKLSDSEVLTMEVVGEFLGLDTDKAIFLFFRRHYAAWFPALGRVHRTTFARQAANLWKVKEHLWQELLLLAPHDPAFAICDSLCPCRPACFRPRLQMRAFSRRSGFRQRYPPQADLLRLPHARTGLLAGSHYPRLGGPGQSAHELSVVPEIVEGTRGVVIGDRNYHSPKTKEELLDAMGVELLAPFSSKKRDPAPKGSALLSRVRYRIDTVFSQLTERYSIKRVWAKGTSGTWPPGCRGRSKSHTVAFLLNHRIGNRPLQLSKLLH